MESQEAWTKFYNTGNVVDYLSYIDTVRTEASELEQNRKRDSDSGNGLS